jgi:ergothioneine biosynthesis protein EgtB
LEFIPFRGGKVSIGHDGNGFAFDNEGPRHERLIQDFSLANRLVTNEEYLNFISDGGYIEPRFWLSDGWTTIQNEEWNAPLYWIQIDGSWFEFTLFGLRPLDLAQPVTHVSFYEADAYASWAGCRLPTEFEWETAARDLPTSGNTVEKSNFHPSSPRLGQTGLTQMFGDVWEWTMSPYTPYPGFKIAEGAVGEYNGKFMSSQMVLRGGSCVSSQDHLRASYRNFFHPQARWQFMGIRLARDITS